MLNTEHLHAAVNTYIREPTDMNKGKLIESADSYRNSFITLQSKLLDTSLFKSKRQKANTTYNRHIEVKRIVSEIPVKLALQERKSPELDEPWWTLSWRTKYSPTGSNRRFYLTKEGCWTIPAAVALEMIAEMEASGGLSDEYHDLRKWNDFKTQVSTKMTPPEKMIALESIIGPDEDWGKDPFFVINSDPKNQWKKLMIINTDDDIATFRSITTDPNYMPRKELRKGADWWLNNSMQDCNVQQMRIFHLHLSSYLAGS